jgi:hypothetical protein
VWSQDSSKKGDQIEPAPLGLTWGATKAQVKELGVALSAEKEGALGQEAIARNLPKALLDTEFVVLQFGFDDRLGRIVIGSTKWPHDRYAIQAKTRFDELVSLLSERYGAGQSLISTPVDSFYQKPENFAYGLSRNERFHAHSWDVKNTRVELSIRASHEDTFYVLIYEYVPLADNAKKGKKGREKEAL